MQKRLVYFGNSHLLVLTRRARKIVGITRFAGTDSKAAEPGRTAENGSRDNAAEGRTHRETPER
jgi:hypothetical protein